MKKTQDSSELKGETIVLFPGQIASSEDELDFEKNL